MNIITYEDIKSVCFSVLNNINISSFIEERKNVSYHTKNILDPERIIKKQVEDCLIPFLVTHMSNKPYTYAEFIKKAHPDNIYISDTKERESFDLFLIEILKLKYDYQNAYIPPFVTYITQSIIRFPKKRKQSYRNYKYRFYNARSYSYIMRNYDCLPYFHKGKFFSGKECEKYYALYIETANYTLMEQIISQYYIDNHFSIYLFAQTVNLLNDEYKKRSLRKHFCSDESYDLYMDYFLYLCVLLQTSSGAFAKNVLLETLHQIFFDVEKNPSYLRKYKSPDKCFKQCAHEIVLYNEIVYPYIQNLYFKEFEKILEKNSLSNKPDEIYKQLETILKIYTRENGYSDWQSTQMQTLNNSTKNLPYIENFILNNVKNKFYDYVPFVSENLIGSQTGSLSEICNTFSNEVFSVIDFKFDNIIQSHYNPIKY